MYTCSMGNIGIVKYLVCEAHCDPDVGNCEGCTPLHIACWYVIRNCTPLHCVTYEISIIIMSGKEVVVEFLLSECNVQSNCTTAKGLTPLSLTNNSTIIELLRQHGAVVDTNLHPDSLSDANTMTRAEKPG